MPRLPRRYVVLMSVPLIELLEVTRDGLVESRHHGHCVLLDANGALEVRGGDAESPRFARSALKPLQAIAMVEAGYPGRDGALALAAASHAGEPMHRDGARAILAGAGLDEAALRCPPALPSGAAALLAYVGAGGVAAPICHNCSGKHAAMLATCVAAGWPTEGYLDPAHPLQVAARATIEVYTGELVAAVAVDGCGAPAFAVSLLGLARAFNRVALAEPGSSAALVRAAMQAYPQLVGGSTAVVSEAIAAVPGLLAKDGAEGIWGAALPDGRAFAAKIEDGSGRGLGPLLAAVLRYWGVDSAALGSWATVPTLGGGHPVGAIAPASELLELLGLLGA